MNKLSPKYQSHGWQVTMPWLAGTFVFLLLLTAGFFILQQRYSLLSKDEKQHAVSLAESARSRLQQSLQYSLSATQALSLAIDKEGIPRDFDSVASFIMKQNRYIDALQLVPDGIIRYVYPLAGNENAIGYNILADSIRAPEAFEAIKRNHLFFAGPFQLKQGGMAVVGRLPVYRKNKFWGFTAVIIRMPTLLAAAGIDSLSHDGYYYQLSKKNAVTGAIENFLPVRLHNAKTVTVTIPDGEWQLSVIRKDVNKLWVDLLPVAGMALLLSIIGGLFAFYLAKEPERLREMVWKRTAQLHESEERNKAFVEAFPDLLFVMDANGRFLDYSAPSKLETLVPRDQFLGKRIVEVMPPTLAGEMQQKLKEAFSRNEILEYSYVLPVKDDLHYFEARYVPQNQEKMLVLVRDVTEMKLAEQKLKESETKYRTLVEQAADGIFIANFTGTFLVVNKAGCKLSQYSESELLSMRIHDLTPPSQLKQMPFKFEDLLAGKTATSERKLIRKDGTAIDVEISAKIISSDRFLAVVRDISERKKAEQELHKSREDLRKLSNYIENIREEERLNLSREIHDELGQQLTVLKMDLSRMHKKLLDEHQQSAPDLERLIGAVNGMVETVRKISADLRPGLLDDLGLAAAIEWYCKDFTRRTGIKTSFINSAGSDEISAPLTIHLFRIFQESLTNAARHARARKIDVSLAHSDERLVLIIGDDGVGFDSRNMEEKKTLGLLGMKERAFAMGGSYAVFSTPGKGTIIEVTVPHLPQTGNSNASL